MKTRQEIIDAIARIEELPVNSSRILEILDDPEARIADIARLVGADAGLTGNCLRLANCAYFGFQRRVGSVEEAIVRIGMSSLRVIVASAFVPFLAPPIQGYEMEAGALLRHSLATAVAAEELAGLLGRSSSNMLFVAALLHDVGKIAMGTFLAVDAQPILALAHSAGLLFDEAERQVLGIDHAEAGAVLLSHWNVPKPIVEVARHHHRPADGDAERELVDLVHYANLLTRLTGIGCGSDGLDYSIDPAVARRLKVPSGGNERVLGRVVEVLAEFESVLGQDSTAE